MQTILLIGSFTGYRSCGDICLLRTCTKEFYDLFGKDTRFLVYINQDLTKSEAFPGLAFSLGISDAYSSWHNILRHARLPRLLYRIASAVLFPLYLIIRTSARIAFLRVWRNVGKASLLYFYGGSQLSQNWFYLNYVPLLITIILCRIRKVPVYFGPQQYGPETGWQRFFLNMTIKLFVKSVRTRNSMDLNLIRQKSSALCYDEVFSCISLYPIVKRSPPKGGFILVNMRELGFFGMKQNNDDIHTNLGAILLKLQYKLGVEIKFFQMTEKSLCDDTAVISLLRKRKEFNSLQYEIMPLCTHEKELIFLAQHALGSISLSFHGCLLSMMAGQPAIPLVITSYYHYKYSDFAKYTGGQVPPLIYLNSTINIEETVNKICSYFSDYQPEMTARAREKAHMRMSQWYQKIYSELSFHPST